jgi:hypothetical protein
VILVGPVVGLLAAGCAAPKIDFAKVQRPERAAELEAYEVFVGSWDWEAQMLNAEAPHDKWTGQATWNWTLDKRCLHGQMTSASGDMRFENAGIWSWHPTKGKYIWWMFNNWGFPQQGTARYDKDTKTWTMPFTGVGLDGTTSYGCYEMKVVNQDTLEWRVDEWADMMHMFKKMEMTGTYKRAG